LFVVRRPSFVVRRSSFVNRWLSPGENGATGWPIGWFAGGGAHIPERGAGSTLDLDIGFVGCDIEQRLVGAHDFARPIAPERDGASVMLRFGI
jgi:hypothetical protein